MNELGVSLLWCAVQVTAVVLLGGLLCLAARRIGSAAGSVVALTTLAVVVGLTLLAASPWPRWWPRAAERDNLAQPSNPATEPQVSGEAAESTVAAAPRPRPQAAGDWSASAATFWAAFEDELAGAPLPANAPRLRWPAALAAALLAGVAIGLGRLLLGLWAIQRLRRSCRLVADADLRETLDVVQAELGCRRPVELRESERLTTAATIGWRRPLVLLPLEWRQWTAAEKRAVLAHEIAHIHNNDFLSMIVAQLGLVLHFYHPLVHWLTGRLRLEQELAADARAARLAGGQRSYLTILAEMALRQADRPLSWPARTFLPSRGTFLRRIEMLRDQKQRVVALSATRRLATIGVVVAVGVLAAGLRAPQREVAAAQQPRPAAADQSPAGDAIDLRNVPSEACIVFAIRPEALFAKPGFAEVAKVLNAEGEFQESLGIPVEQLEQVTLVALRQDPQPGAPPRPPEPRGMIFRATQPHDWAKFAAANVADAVPVRYAGQTYYKSSSQPGGVCYYLADDRTIVIDQEANIYRYILRGQGLPGEAAWSGVFGQVESSVAAAAIDMGCVRMLINEDMLRDPKMAPFAALAPIWEESTALVVGARFDDPIQVKAVFGVPTPEGREKVAQTSQALITLATNMLNTVQQQAAALQEPDAAIAAKFFGQIEALLKVARIEQGEASVVVTAEGTAETAQLVAALAPAVAAAREAARRTQSTNNLRQLALAMYNYHDVNKSFPPAVLYSDNSTPYSWRVALLPYLSQDALYRQYKFDEPWNSPNNMQVAQQMPPVFRDPGAQNAPLATSYFVLTGGGSMFGDRTGTTLPEIRDGTSNTMMIVEAVRDITWTEPADIAYDPAQPLPEFGGIRPAGFDAALADGSVRFFNVDVPEGLLRAIITKAGGEVVTFP